ncbi:MAG: tetratricopeptide repeat protein [Alphaproteobacteria bacterium]|nr:tetratricopeptide repeat protein [Alphaproteobacteria bacterium]
MADIFQEVDEALKQERVKKFWKENGPHLVAAAIIVVIGTAAINIYRSWDLGRNEAGTAKIMAALEAENIPASLEDMKDELRSDQRSVALLMAAGGYVQDNEREEALRVYSELASSSGTPAILRQYAALMQSRLLLDMPDQQADAPRLYGLLEPMTADPESAWHGHALLQAAVTAAHVESDFQAAANFARRASESPTVHESLKGRARALQHVYEVRLSRSNATEAKTGEQSGETQE